MENKELKPCPFCGQVASLEVTDCRELEECALFEECEETGSQTVVCSVNMGGCGGASGYAPTREAAIEQWNTRAGS